MRSTITHSVPGLGVGEHTLAMAKVAVEVSDVRVPGPKRELAFTVLHVVFPVALVCGPAAKRATHPNAEPKIKIKPANPPQMVYTKKPGRRACPGARVVRRRSGGRHRKGTMYRARGVAPIKWHPVAVGEDRGQQEQGTHLGYVYMPLPLRLFSFQLPEYMPPSGKTWSPGPSRKTDMRRADNTTEIRGKRALRGQVGDQIGHRGSKGDVDNVMHNGVRWFGGLPALPTDHDLRCLHV